jgi:hypothetical protein
MDLRELPVNEPVKILIYYTARSGEARTRFFSEVMGYTDFVITVKKWDVPAMKLIESTIIKQVAEKTNRPESEVNVIINSLFILNE